MIVPRRWSWSFVLLLLACCLPGRASAEDDPPLQDGSQEAANGLRALRLPPGMKIAVFAAEPQLGNPVALCQDEQGRIFVAEEYRFNRGTEENRTSPWLLTDDLQIKTLADRLAMYRRHANHYQGGMNWFTRHADKIRLLEDRDGDGRADRSTEFARFQEPLDGLAAGVLAYRGTVYATCIPNLWRLRDTTGSRSADVREKLLTGFGVNAGFLGHDLHGLAWGPDGKLYFSVGDRGYHVDTKEGKSLSDPRTGSVFRCNPDGTELEAIFRGLRNPQEIAFDDFGNLFAADNNCDKGDSSRLMYIVEGGDGGWRMEYQSLPKPYLAGPWLAEKMWETAHAGQPKSILPSSGAIGAGPSGFAYYPGTGLADNYRGCFFLCNFTGNGGIEVIRPETRGAGFQIASTTDFLKPIQASDLEFGYDGKIYISHFVKLEWLGGNGGGRVYSMFDPNIVKSPIVNQVRTLFRNGFSRPSTAELAGLLGHADQRIRRESQFTLVERALQGNDSKAALNTLLQATQSNSPLVARLHGLWGLGQLSITNSDARTRIANLLADPELEIRAHAARLVGDHGIAAAAGQLVSLLKDKSPRVRMFAALSLGKLKYRPAAMSLVELLRSNNDDAYLRHAAVMGLLGVANSGDLQSLTTDPSSEVRLGVLLVERRLRNPSLVRFLDDTDPVIVLETARAINDLPLLNGEQRLAELDPANRPALRLAGEPLLRRWLNSCFRLGRPEDAARVLGVALDQRYSEPVRLEALQCLADWTNPAPRDRVNGFWRPLAPRSPSVVASVLGPRVTELLSLSGTVELQQSAVQLISKLNLPLQENTFIAWVRDRQRPVTLRIAALQLLAARQSPGLAALIAEMVTGDAALLRAEARDLLLARDPEQGVTVLQGCLTRAESELCERQRALTALARTQNSRAEQLLEQWGERLASGRVPPELQLDVYEAVNKKASRSTSKVPAKLPPEVVTLPGITARSRLSLHGGDIVRGRRIFLENGRLECTRCHKVGGQGGTAGPDLSSVGTRHSRETLLESLLVPDARIAPGFGTVSLVLSNGKVLAGVLKAESKHSLTLLTPELRELTIRQEDIDERSPPKSAMPSAGPHLELRDLRDLIEFLASLKEPPR